VLEYHFGRDISDVLAMSVTEDEFFGSGARYAAAHKILTHLADVGLDLSPASRSRRCPAANGSGARWPPT
jgi:excinuclease UvrABC ATPase subunit